VVLRASFSDQKSVLVFGMLAFRHPLCWCQKHPCTKITFFLDRNTISGRPGKSAACNRYRKPSA